MEGCGLSGRGIGGRSDRASTVGHLPNPFPLNRLLSTIGRPSTLRYANGKIVENDDAERSARIGDRVQFLRKARRMTLRQLADATQTTASFISQLERGLSGASTSTLMRIADALAVSISDLFEERTVAPHHVLMRSARPALPVAENYRKTLLSRRPIREFEVYVGEFGPGGSTGEKPYVHGHAHEMFLVLRGQVELTLGDVEYVMREGDSIEYPTSTPHKTRNLGDSEAEVLWIISPPTSGLAELDKYNLGKPLASGDSQSSGPQRKGNDDNDGKNSD